MILKKLLVSFFAGVCLTGLAGTNVPGARTLTDLNGTWQTRSDKEITCHYPPYLEPASAARVKPVLKTITVHDFYGKNSGNSVFGVFKAGNKEVRVQSIKRLRAGLILYVTINDKDVGQIKFRAGNKNGFGYPYKPIEGDPARFEFNTDTGVATFVQNYLGDKGEKKRFTCTMTALDGGKIKLEYNDAAAGVLINNEYRDKKITFDGQVFGQSPRAKLVAEKKEIATRGLGGVFSYNPDHPELGYSIDFGRPTGMATERLHVSPKTAAERYTLTYYASASQGEGRAVIDLGPVALAREDAPPPVGGIDFWKEDAVHVPLPATRNVMPNPSFEQGLRYWSWVVVRGARYFPEDKNQTRIVDGGLFGNKALLYRRNKGCSASKSFPMALDKGAPYTFSFYAKATTPGTVRVFLQSAAKGGQFDKWTPKDAFHKVTTDWQRFSKTFTADDKGVFVVIASGSAGDVLFDGLQLEKGERPTDFVCSPIEGTFVTSHPDNDIVKGDAFDASFVFTGKPGTTGEVEITARNVFREVLYKGVGRIQIGADGTQKVDVPFDENAFGEGIFVVKAEYRIPGTVPYYEYYRFSVMAPLANTHATKNLFSASTAGPTFYRISRGDDLARKYKEWGFGSVVKMLPITPKDKYPHYPLYLDMLRKNRIQNIFSGMYKVRPEYGRPAKYEWKEITPEMEKQIEEDAYNMAKGAPLDTFQVYGFGNEEEGGYLISHKMFDEYCKAQYATYRGIKRANPKAMVAPTSGPSGYNMLRGYDEFEGYLKAAKKRGFKYDAIAIHPYNNVDKGWLSREDRDTEHARLIDQLARHGYGKDIPIYADEGGNICPLNIPQWATGGGDSYRNGNLTYDVGNKELIHAATYARQFIIDLKYWPRIQHSNVWTIPMFVDQYLTPRVFCKAVNTLGHQLGWVEFVKDVKPYAGIRGYAFKLEDGTGVVPIWCVDVDVEKGYRRGPEIEVKFDQEVTFVDLMGNRRYAKPGANGYTKIRLAPSPLLVKAADVDKLADALLHARLTDARNALKVAIQPREGGQNAALIENQTSFPQRGTVVVGKAEIPYEIPASGKKEYMIPGSDQGNRPGTMYKLDTAYSIVPDKGEKVDQQWSMDYFYVPHTDGSPDWSKVPGIKVATPFNPPRRRRIADKTTGKLIREFDQKLAFNGDQDFSAVCKLAWDKNNLYLRVEVTDDTYAKFPDVWKAATSEKALYKHDGSLEVYFDCGANGRSNGIDNYDDDDYRYDFSPPKDYRSGPGLVYRLKQVDHQLAGGVGMPDQKEVAEKVTCDVEFTETGYVYTITFGQRYIEPLWLRQGVVAGFCVLLHDRDDPADRLADKALTLSAKEDEHPQSQPALWPLMLLSN
jgi:hypothetical protein